MSAKALIGRQSNRTHIQKIRTRPATLFDNPDKAALEQTLSEIHELSLESNLVELEVQGYTTIKEAIPPDQLTSMANQFALHQSFFTGNKDAFEHSAGEINCQFLAIFTVGFDTTANSPLA